MPLVGQSPPLDLGVKQLMYTETVILACTDLLILIAHQKLGQSDLCTGRNRPPEK